MTNIAWRFTKSFQGEDLISHIALLQIYENMCCKMNPKTGDPHLHSMILILSVVLLSLPRLNMQNSTLTSPNYKQKSLKSILMD